MDDDRLQMIGLASRGYGGGTIDGVGSMAVEDVLDIEAYVRFESEYLETKRIMNQPEGR